MASLLFILPYTISYAKVKIPTEIKDATVDGTNLFFKYIPKTNLIRYFKLGHV